MAQMKVSQPKQMNIQSKSSNQSLSVFNKVSTEKVNRGVKSPTWVRSGTETMGQMARLLRGKLPK